MTMNLPSPRATLMFCAILFAAYGLYLYVVWS